MISQEPPSKQKIWLQGRKVAVRLFKKPRKTVVITQFGSKRVALAVNPLGVTDSLFFSIAQRWHSRTPRPPSLAGWVSAAVGGSAVLATFYFRRNRLIFNALRFARNIFEK
jgi:hypothetical protein